MKIFECKDVTFFYPEDTKPAIERINFSLEKGKIYVLCGQSASGKSTLLKHMKKEQIPFGTGTGQMYYCNQILEEMDTKQSCQEIGFVGQLPDEQIVTDKVWHELAFGLESLGIKPMIIRQKIAEVAEYFGIGQWFHRKTDTLSGGQKQILNLASVMAMEPKLLLLDEPTSQLDPIGAERFLHTVEKINKEFGTTVVISEQRLEEVLSIADEILIMHDGKLLEKGKVRECAALLQDGRKMIGKELPVEKGMPVSVRAYIHGADIGSEVDNKEEFSWVFTPLTVREGQFWLESWRTNREKKQMYQGQQKQDWQESIVSEDKKEQKSKNKQVAIEAKNVVWGYERGKEVLKDFSIKIPKQKITAILGGNGSGKTTALKVLTGIYKVKQGKVKQSEICGYLPQNPQTMFTEATVEEELADVICFGKPKIEPSVIRAEVEQMLNRMELVSQREKNPFDLSGGQAQRLAIGKILLTDASIIAMDEPTKGMDAAFKEAFAKMLRKLVADGKTIILVSHDITFCSEYSDYCGFLFDGQMISSSATREFFKQNTFYTTQARKMAVHSYPEVVTVTDLFECM